MFFDIGSLEFITLVVLAILVFGPEKLPKMIQDAARVLRKIREFSDSAKQDIRAELGPEFKDFEFEDLNPRTFARKHLLDNDDLGLKELTSSLDMRQELSEVADAVNGRPATRPSLAKGNGARNGRAAAAGLGKTGGSGANGSGPAAGSAGAARVRLEKSGDAAPGAAPEPPPYDLDAT
ncbi:sec-independent translocase [Streptomyces hoynatensis]|uniref:Sec-independent protein translocase protein TatB n=1 Tax=Streptomyces hoynatensis TaxID=1141874 RepID=A0A3A9ZHD0_9ACTN|nr:sec-independent translocase [Streptomyces hoynatensis]RKN47084.1 Sec-independent protein translocase subunit TatB [Streptomyces hoynatensis]